MSRPKVLLEREARPLVVGEGAISELLEELQIHGPEVRGLIVELDPGAVDRPSGHFTQHLPRGWKAELLDAGLEETP